MSFVHEVTPLAPSDVLRVHGVPPAMKKALTGDEQPPVPFAEPRQVDVTPLEAGVWDTFADGSRLWRLPVQAEGATDLNFGFERFRLPPGAALHVYSPTHDYYQGPYGVEHNASQGQLWTPVVPGSRAVLELYIPADAEYEPELRLTQVGAGYRDLFMLEGDYAKQAGCNIDVVCPQGDAWRDEIRSVGRYTLSGRFLCTGTLVADVPGSHRPFFLTAAHCGITARNAASIVVYWNYESPVCGQLGGGSLAENQSGARLRMTKQDVDLALVELSVVPDPTYEVYYAGWDRSGVPPLGSVGIHHPMGDEKAISVNEDPLTTGSCIDSSRVDSHWIVDDWEQGITEMGSSGSGLFDSATNRLIGVLSGGASSCARPFASDCYGKFSEAWDAGLSASQRLADWLDPEATGATNVDGRDGPDDARYTWHIRGSQDGFSSQRFGFRGVLPVPSDFDGDGRADIAVYDPTGFAWFVNGTREGFFQRAFGFPGAAPVPADYDGDGATDIAVFDERLGNWYVLGSASGFFVQQFGFEGVRPVPADYDGDGADDHAVFEPSAGLWFILGSQGGYRLQQFGFAGVTPVPGDYDGDGSDDPAVFDPVTGTWYWLGSRGGAGAQQFGFAGVTPIPGDYDGNGTTDRGVYDPSADTWYFPAAEAGASMLQFGFGNTLPLASDFDGDGRDDVVVYKPGPE